MSNYPAVSRQAASVMHMIMNNLDPRVAQVTSVLNKFDETSLIFHNDSYDFLLMNLIKILFLSKRRVKSSTFCLTLQISAPIVTICFFVFFFSFHMNWLLMEEMVKFFLTGHRLVTFHMS